MFRLANRTASRVALAAAVVIIHHIHASAENPSTPESSVIGTFTGRVLSAEGRPIPSALVTLPNYGDAAPIGQCTTDGDGRFKMPVKDVDGHLIHRRSPALIVEAEGYVATYVDDRELTVFKNANRDLGNIVLDSGRSYSGTVVDVTGRPISGASVKCGAVRHLAGHSVEPIGKEQQVATDGQGRFHTPRLPSGSPYVTAYAEGFLQRSFDRKQFSEADSKGQLPDLVLQPDKPIQGTVANDLGKPLGDVEVRANGITTKTDSQGRFVLRGFGENAQFQFQIRVDGYAFINWGVTASAEGFAYYDVAESAVIENSNPEAFKKAMDEITVRVPKLEIKLQREAEIRGRVVDAETNDPVTISRIVLCTFTRKKDGEIVLIGCRRPALAQPKPGQFSIGYSVPTEYHLTISAEGYQDAEAYTPPVSALQSIEGIMVKMTRKGAPAIAHVVQLQRIEGVLASDVTLPAGSRAALWSLPRGVNAANAWIARGRTTVGDGNVVASKAIVDGRFLLDVPYQRKDWYVLVETPERVVAIHGPIALEKGETKSVEIQPLKPGSLHGFVSNCETAPRPQYAVLFSDVGLQYEVRVQPDGRFTFSNIHPGKYGVKVGCDSILDSEVPDVMDNRLTTAERLALHRRPGEPWKRAMRVDVEEGKKLEEIEVRFEP